MRLAGGGAGRHVHVEREEFVGGRFSHSRGDEKANSRSRHGKRLAAFVAFFVVGLTVSVALAAPNVIGVITGTTGTDTTAAEPSTTNIGSTVADDPAATVGVAA